MSRTNVRFIVCLTLICLIAAAVPASAQHFKQITGTPLSQIAAGRKEVWGLYNSRVYRFSPNTQTFAEIPGSLSQIAVGGGTLMQSDEVWGLDASGFVYRFNFSNNAFTSESGPSALQLSQIAVGAGYEDNCHPYEVWGINQNPSYTYRYNYCTSQFENIPNILINVIVPPGGIGFTQIAVSSAGDVWGLYSYESSAPAVLEFTGAGWDGPGDAYGISFQQTAVGVNDVWAIDSTGYIWSWSPARLYGFGGPNLNGTLASGYLPSSSALATQIATGGDGVWVLYNLPDGGNGLIGRFDFQRGYFPNVPLPANANPAAVQIAVGSGAGVWVLDASDEVFTFVRP